MAPSTPPTPAPTQTVDPNHLSDRYPPKNIAVAETAGFVIEHMLGDGDSVIEPGTRIWTAENGQALNDAILQHPIVGKEAGNTIQKFQQQLKEQPREVVLLAAECIFLRDVAISTDGEKPKTKLSHLDGILGLINASAPDQMREALLGQKGAFGFGLYLIQLHTQLPWLARFVTRWEQLDDRSKADACQDPWVFRHVVADDDQDLPCMRDLLLFLAFPRVFDPMVNEHHKSDLLDAAADGAFNEFLTAAGCQAQTEWAAGWGHKSSTHTGEERDQAVAGLRAWFRPELGPINWYKQPYRTKWHGPFSPVGPLPPASPELVEGTHFDKGWLDEVIGLLGERGQMILYGPPGTGKTFLARELAKHITGDADAEAGAGQNSAGGADASECWELVQFHPSYAYEDFVEGIRPKIGQGTAKGTVEFALHEGPLRRIAEQAAQHPEHNYVLIIDEINRADLARVFGELYYLLEYRGETVTLQYSNEKLTLPKNLYFIGTMNTADRSIALVDAAIRRRFPFVEMHPGTEPVKGLLANVYGKDDNRTKLLDALNEAIGEDKRDLWIGPSYLMRKKPSDGAPTPTELERVWKYDILPRLAEEFYDDEHGDVANQFSLDTIAKKAGVKLTAEKPAAETDGDGTGAGHESPASGGATEQPAEGNHTDGTAADQAAAGSGAGTVAPGGTPTPSPDPASGN